MKKQLLIMLMLLFVALNMWAQTTREVPGTYATIQSAINAASSGDIINVAAGTYAEALAVNKAISLQGAGSGTTIIQPTAGTNAITISTAGTSGNVAHYIFDGIQVLVSGAARGILAGDLSYISIEMNNSIINYSQLGGVGLLFGTSGGATTGNNVSVTNSTIQCPAVAGASGDKGIAWYQSSNSTLTVTNSTITAAYYAIRTQCPYLIANITGSTLTGYAGLNINSGNSTFNISTSTLTGRSWATSACDDSYGAIAFQSIAGLEANNTTVNTTNSTLTNQWVEGGASYECLIMANDGSYSNKVYFDNASIRNNTNTNYAPYAIALYGTNNKWYINNVEQVNNANVIFVNSSTGNDANSGECPGAAKKTIQAAITAATAGFTINVAAGTYSEALAVNKAITLKGAGSGTTIIQPTAGTNAITISTSGTSGNVAHYIFDDIQLLVSGTGRGINTGDRDYISIELENSTINYSETGRGIALGTTNGGTDNAISVLNSSIVCSATGGSDQANRGISFFHSANSSLTITNSTVTAGHYALTLNSPGLLVNISGSSITGYAALNLHNTGSTINISNSTLTGRSFWGGPSDAYGAIAFDGGFPCSNTTVNVTNSTITNLWVGSGATSFESLISDGDGCTGNKVYLDAASQLINTNSTKAPLCVFAVKGNFEWYVNSILQNPVGVDLYVNTTTGNDANSGEAPVLAKKTIQAAITAASAGNIINVATGTYNESLTINKSLTLNGAQADVEPSGSARSGGESVISNEYPISIQASNVTLKGFEIKDFGHGIFVPAAAFAANSGTLTNITVAYNWLHSEVCDGEARGAFTAEPGFLSGLIISHNYIYVNTTNGGPNCIGFSGSTANPTYENVEISFNYIRSPAGYGIFAGADPTVFLINGIKINNNHFVENGASFNVGNIKATLSFPAEFKNNTVENAGGSLGIQDGTISGNTFTNGGRFGLYGNMFGFTRASNNVSITNNIFNDNVNGRGLTVDNYADNSFGFESYGPATIDATSIHVHNNKFQSTATGNRIRNLGLGSLDASCNWFGTADPSQIETASSATTMVLGSVTYYPYNISDGGACSGYPPVHNVTQSTYSATIQAAINAATANDVINVAAGIYKENLSISKPLSIIGASRDNVIINAQLASPQGGTGIAILNTNNVIIKNITIKDAKSLASTNWDDNEAQGILISNSDNCLIDNVKLLNNGWYEIFLWNGSDHNTITNCIIDGKSSSSFSTLDGIFSSGGPIIESGSNSINTYNTFSNNSISNVVFGISLAGSSNTTVSGNNINPVFDITGGGYFGYGINIFHSQNNTISRNVIDGNNHDAFYTNAIIGIRLRNANGDYPIDLNSPQANDDNLSYAGNTSGNNIDGNTIKNFINGTNGQGIKIQSYTPNPLIVSDNVFTNNIIKDNYTGIQFWDNVLFTGNEFSNNSITGNTSIGFENQGSLTINASNNYWGDATGPHHTTLNSAGLGNSVGNSVSFIPWWCDAAMTSKCAPAGAIVNTTTGDVYGPAELGTALDAADDGQTLYVAPGTVSGTIYNDVTPGKTVYISGSGIPGQSKLSGASPALTVTAGNIIIKDGIEFIQTTDAPTILVTGGELTLRDCIINESTIGDQTCLKVEGGTVDAGTALLPGGNKFVVNGTGSAIDNIPLVTLPAIGNDWGNPTGPTIASNPSGIGFSIVGAGKDYVEYDPFGGGPVITASNVTICAEATTVDIPIKASQLSNVGSFALTIGFTPVQLTAPTIVSRNAAFNATGHIWPDFEVTSDAGMLAAGVYKISGKGDDPSDGVSLANDAVLFTLRFNIGSIANTAALTFNEDVQGTACEFTGVAPTYVPYGDMPTATSYFDGSVIINNLSPNTIADAQTICYNTTPNLLTGSTVVGGTITYQWQSSTDGSSFTDLATGTYTATSYQPDALTTSTWYQRVATSVLNGVSCSTTSDAVKITVYNNFTPGAILTTGEVICYNGNPSEIGNNATANGGNETITYKWESSLDGFATAGSVISGATSSSYDPPTGLTATTSYRRYAHDGSCNTSFEVSTGTWTVTVYNQFTTGAIATTGEAICYGATPSTQIGSSTDASGGHGTITYEWRSSADAYATAISGATSSTYTPSVSLTTTTSYRRYAHDATCNTSFAVSTGTWIVTVNPLPTITTTGTATSVCYSAASQTTTLDYTETTNTPTSYSIVWDSDAQTAGFSNQSSTSFSFTSDGTSGPITGIVIPEIIAPATYYGTMTITTANGCTATQDISVQVLAPYFRDNAYPPNYSLTWDGILSFGNSSITQLQDYTQTSDYTFMSNVRLDLNGYRFNNVNNTNTIASSKTFSLTSDESGAAPNGVFDGKLTFGDVTSMLHILSAKATLGSSFSISPYGSSGTVRIGDGTTSINSYDWNNDDIRLNNKLANLIVAPNVTVNLTGGSSSSVTNFVDGIVILSASTYSNTFAGSWGGTIVIGTGASEIETLTGDLSDFHGTTYIMNGSSLFLSPNNGVSSFNNGNFQVGGNSNTAATKLTPTTATYLGGVSLDKYGILDLSSLTSDLNVEGITFINSGANDGLVKFLLGSTTTYKLDLGSNSFNPDASNMLIDFNNITPTSGSHSFVLATSTGTITAPTALPTIINAPNWGLYSLEIVGNNLVLYASYCENPSDGGEIATDQSHCGSFTPAAITSTADASSDYLGTLEYKWQSSTDGSSFSDIITSNSSTYAPGNLTVSTWYKRLARVDCKSDWTGAAESNIVKMTVYSNFTTGAIATTGEIICYGGTPATEIGSTTYASGGDGAITYEWRSSADAYATAISGAESATYTPAAGLTATTTYRRYAHDAFCNTSFDLSVGTYTVTVYDQFITGAIATTGEAICNGGTPATEIGSTTDASGGHGTITYEWRSSADAYATAISGAISSTYTPAAGLTASTSYRRYAYDATCNTSATVSTGTWTVTVYDQFTTGAISTTGETICTGATPSTQIGSTTDASGGHGTITYEWRSSADAYATAISGATSATYTPSSSLTATTSYRRYAHDALCNTSFVVSTGAWTVTVNQLQKISGTFNYNNTANTPLTHLIHVVLQKQSDHSFVAQMDVNSGTGAYEFTNLCPDTYEIVATSTHPTAGSVNTTDAGQVNAWGVSPYVIENGRFYAGDVKGNNYFLNSLDAQRIQQNFVNGTAFESSSNWIFWKVGEATISSNTLAAQSTPTVTLANTDLVQNMYGLCMGDFNRSFNPSLAKSASSSLNLIYAGNKQISSNQAFDLPLHIVDANSVGAISLILNFPANLVEVQDVLLSATNEQLDWSVNGNELRIGWNSQTPVNLANAAEMITLKLKTTAAFVNDENIQLTLVSNPLNELADAQFNVINNAVLSVDVINASAVGISEQSNVNTLTLSNRPNPFNGSTTIDYELPYDGMVSLKIYNYVGSCVKTIVGEQQLKGNHSLKFEAGSLPAGVYMATLIVKSENNEMVRTIKLICNR